MYRSDSRSGDRIGSVPSSKVSVYPLHLLGMLLIARRGLPMSIFTFWVTLGPGLAPVIFSWVEADPRFEWRWIQWFQMSTSLSKSPTPLYGAYGIVTFGLYFPIVVLVLRETRATVLLRRKAKKLRTERGMQDGGRYTAKSEVNKLALGEAMKHSLSRPLSKLSRRKW